MNDDHADGAGLRLEGLERVRSGKVRDVFRVDDEQLLLVASDRVSTFDVVHPTTIPDKGKVLTGVSRFWFERLHDVVDNHLVTTDLDRMPAEVQRHRDVLAGRTMLVRDVDVVGFECVVRGYLAGSAWAEYEHHGTVCGIALPEGLVEADQLPEPIFTPATKAEAGEHDENVTFEVMDERLAAAGHAGLAARLRELSIELFTRARGHARDRGILLADTKFEFGLLDGRVLLADEVLTPDSSRWWPADRWQPGTTPPSFDKQFVRDYATSTGWDKTPPAPVLPADVVERTREKYAEAYERITGEPLAGWLSAS